LAGALVVFAWAFDVYLDTYLPRACLFFCFVHLIWGPGTLEEREQMCCLVVTSGKICCSVTQTHKSFRNSMHINIYVFTHMLILFAETESAHPMRVNMYVCLHVCTSQSTMSCVQTTWKDKESVVAWRACERRRARGREGGRERVHTHTRAREQEHAWAARHRSLPEQSRFLRGHTAPPQTSFARVAQSRRGSVSGRTRPCPVAHLGPAAALWRCG